MKEQAPPFKILFENGKYGNFIKVHDPVPQLSILERLSDMKFGRKRRDRRVHEMLHAISKKVAEEMYPVVIPAAESVLIDYYTKSPSLGVYDVDNEEHVVFMFDAGGSYIIRVTQWVYATLCAIDIPTEQLFVFAALDYPSLIENIKFERDQCLAREDYKRAAQFRDDISFLESKALEISQGEQSQ